ncbi:hypothetical protein GCM10022224_073850 [Nonomuraea antimicrobica]|uniref:Sortase family protein n=1 Tax=Nonomuraea antimicrobica TaxID=561173 RepID=A0ABP7D010_9ACTN
MRALLATATCTVLMATSACATGTGTGTTATGTAIKTATKTDTGTAAGTATGITEVTGAAGITGTAAIGEARGGGAVPVADRAGRTTTEALSSASADAAAPVRLRIPAIKLSTRVIPLRLDKKGKLIAPTKFDRVGWNQSGPEPGEKGVAVIAGHVDSKTGPAVFYRLRQLSKGDRIHVDRADGSTVTFVVGRLARYPKSNIPNKVVYGQSKSPELRLITCGGTFDRARSSYRDNVIVFAS